MASELSQTPVFTKGELLNGLQGMVRQHRWDDLRHLARDSLRKMEETGEMPDLQTALWLSESAEQSCVPVREMAVLASQLGPNVAARQAFREVHADELNSRTFVPMGCECHPWVILNRWGFRDSLEDLNPLCLGVHRMPGLVEILENRFAGYAHPASVGTRIHCASKEPMAVNDAQGITWNHHRGEAWCSDGFVRFYDEQQRLAANFYTASRKPGAVHVVSRWKPFRPETCGGYLERLLRVIAEAGAATPRLVVIDMEPDKFSPGLHRLSEEVTLVSRPYPEGYSWSAIKDYNSPAGVEWERSVIQDLLAAVA